MNDLVSIIMPSYNTAQYITETIQSVINQTYQNWELIIVDDCSTDDTDIVVGRIKDPRIKYIKNEKNSGAAISRNRALRTANGRWVAFLDSDDLWKPEKLERQIRFMLKKKCYFSYTNYEEIDSDGNRMNVIVTGPKVITKTEMFNYCWPGCLTVMYDRKKIGLIQIEDIKKNNDYAMWLKVCRKADCYLLDEILGQYRKGRVGSVSTHSIRTMIVWHYKLYREAEDMEDTNHDFLTELLPWAKTLPEYIRKPEKKWIGRVSSRIVSKVLGSCRLRKWRGIMKTYLRNGMFKEYPYYIDDANVGFFIQEIDGKNVVDKYIYPDDSIKYELDNQLVDYMICLETCFLRIQRNIIRKWYLYQFGFSVRDRIQTVILVRICSVTGY